MDGFPERLERHLATTEPALRARRSFPTSATTRAMPRRGLAIGVSGEAGVVAAASEHHDFPRRWTSCCCPSLRITPPTAFQSARLIQRARKRQRKTVRKARDELEVKVAERTAELRRSQAYLAQLADEQAALRRVATLVAEGVPASEIFAAVTREVHALFPGDIANLGRYESDESTTVLAAHDNGADVGSRWPLDGFSTAALVKRSGQPEWIDNWARRQQGAFAEAARARGIVSSVGAPIVVDGAIWGVLVIASRKAEPLPSDTESRLLGFCELVTTTLFNSLMRAPRWRGSSRRRPRCVGSRRWSRRTCHRASCSRRPARRPASCWVRTCPG